MTGETGEEGGHGGAKLRDTTRHLNTRSKATLHHDQLPMPHLMFETFMSQ